MSKHLEELQEIIKWLSERDYQNVEGDNIINPQFEKDGHKVEKQEHVTSSGAADWLESPDKTPTTTFGLKKPGLVPYTSLVRRTGKTPYFATRWRKVDPEAEKEEINIIPVENFQGDLEQVYDAWKKYVGQQEDADSQDLLLPLLGLQDFLEEGRKGILAQMGNRIIGLASLEVDDMNEARLSILSASPLEIEEANESYVEDALREGLETYVDEREYNLITSTDANVEQESIKKAYHHIRLAKAKLPDQDKQVLAQEARRRGLLPQTGDWLKPGRWVTREEAKALGVTSDAKQQRETSEERQRGRYSEQKDLVSPEEGAEKGIQPGKTAGGYPIPEGATDIQLNPDPDALVQAHFRNKDGKARKIYSNEHHDRKTNEKYGRGREMAMDEPAIINFLDEERAKGVVEAEVLRLMAWTSLRIGNAREGEGEEQAYGASTLLGKNVIINGSQVELHFTGKAGQPIELEFDNEALAQMLWDRKGQKTKGNLYDVTDNHIRRYLELKMLPALGLQEKGYLPKDFRTLGARAMTVEAISKLPKPTSKREFKQGKKAVIMAVARGLGNTPDVAEKSYIDPILFADWEGNFEE